MGEFLSAAALRGRSADAIAQSIQAYASESGVTTQPIVVAESDSATDAQVFVPRARWNVVAWPAMFHGHDIAAARWLSRSLQTLVSHVAVYDGDFWEHVLFVNGELIDAFRSRPAYFSERSEDMGRLREEWRGNPGVIANALGISADGLLGYLLDLDSSGQVQPPTARVSLLQRLGWRRRPEQSALLGKAFPEDEFELDNPWVFIDFWRRLGIVYPEDGEEPQRCLRFTAGFDGLPIENR
jgi:hypothetical protein